MWKKVLLNRNRHSKTDPGSYSSVKCGKYSAAWGCAVIFMDTRVWSLPCPRFIHGFFRSKASANRNRSVRMLALPLVKKRREPKSFLSRAKAQMDASFRGEALRGFLTFLPKGLLQAQLLRLFRVLGPAALAAAGAASTVLTAVPGGRDELAVFYLRTRPVKAYSHKKARWTRSCFRPFFQRWTPPFRAPLPDSGVVQGAERAAWDSAAVPPASTTSAFSFGYDFLPSVCGVI